MSDDLSIGERIAHFRRRRGLSQLALAARLGRSESWVSKVERGERRIDRLSVIEEVAKALDVEPVALTGHLGEPRPPGMPEPPKPQAAAEGVIESIREVFTRPDRVVRALQRGERQREVPGLLRLRRAVDHAWRAFQATRYSVLGRVLPELIAEAQLATDELRGDEALAATGLLAQAYQVSTITLIKLGARDLAWLSADRSIDTAKRSGDELLLGGSARGMVHALLEQGQFTHAKELATKTAAAFESRLGRGSPALLSIYGALLLRGSVAAGRQGDRSATRDMLREAAVAADLLGVDRNCCWTAFGPTNVAVHRVHAAVQLGDGGEAVEQGLTVDLEALPVTERKARFLIDLAHGYTLCGKDSEAFTTLLKAERLAPEEVRLTPIVREIVGELLRRQRRSAGRELRALADRVGALR